MPYACCTPYITQSKSLNVRTSVFEEPYLRLHYHKRAVVSLTVPELTELVWTQFHMRA